MREFFHGRLLKADNITNEELEEYESEIRSYYIKLRNKELDKKQEVF
jgi:hypothetical protein